MITREEVYQYLYRIHKAISIDLHDIDADTASRLANIYAVKETNRFWYHAHRNKTLVDIIIKRLYRDE